MKRVLDFVTSLQSASTFDEAWVGVRRFFESEGADWNTYGYETCGDDGKASIVIRDNYPAHWNAHYSDRNYAQHDYAVLHCQTQIQPLPMGIEWAPATLSPIERQVSQEASEFGLHSGIIFPSRIGPDQRRAGLAFTNGMKRVEFARFIEDRQEWLFMAAACAQAYLQHLVDAPPTTTISLTSRQRECLLWAARGLKTTAIGERLGISEQAVYLHLANAKKKLGTIRRIDAVAKAIRLGLIGP
ncbi:MAG: LuxR family transcriptional regulator [Rhodospirillaceae bacterium]|nr:LuxR family transcriptional regulator [Rhodospirillales bacterium]